MSPQDVATRRALAVRTLKDAGFCYVSSQREAQEVIDEAALRCFVEGWWNGECEVIRVAQVGEPGVLTGEEIDCYDVWIGRGRDGDGPDHTTRHL